MDEQHELHDAWDVMKNTVHSKVKPLSFIGMDPYHQATDIHNEGTHAPASLTHHTDYDVNRTTAPNQSKALQTEAGREMPIADPPSPVEKRNFIPILLVGGLVLYLFLKK